MAAVTEFAGEKPMAFFGCGIRRLVNNMLKRVQNNCLCEHDDQVNSTTQALDYLREPDIAAEYLRAYSGENVLDS